MSQESAQLHPDAVRGEMEVSGRRITFHDTGTPGDDRTPILLVHGTGGSTEAHFRTVYPMLAARHRVIGIDASLTEDDSLEEFVQQVEDLLIGRTQGGPCHLVGYSLGAVVAAALAGTRPALVQTLTLIAGWIKTDKQQALRNSIWKSLRQEGSTRTLQEFQTLLAYSPQFIRTRADADMESLISQRTFHDDIDTHMRINRDVDVAEQVEAIAAPTLVIGCEQDIMVPIAHSHQLFGGIANSRLAEVDAGHAVTTERPAQLFMLIDDFVREPDQVKPGDVVPALTI